MGFFARPKFDRRLEYRRFVLRLGGLQEYLKKEDVKVWKSKKWIEIKDFSNFEKLLINND